MTEYTQAAMVTTCIAITEVLREQGLKPDTAAGLSLGEYCAVSAAGAMNTSDAISVVRQRGIFYAGSSSSGRGRYGCGSWNGKIRRGICDARDGRSLYSQ